MAENHSTVIPSRKEIAVFRRKIMSWFKKNGRFYPWRQTEDPFRILIAEMMLRRTRADQVKPVYERFFNEFPCVESVADADEQKIEQILHPLGLKWRVPALRLVAGELRDKYNCRVPERREELEKLPGVGQYVAGAVLSIGYGKKEWIVDSNIVRLFRRYFGIRTSKEGRRDKPVIDMAKVYVSCKNPGKANLALIDFASLVCRPHKPACNSCCLAENCFYRSRQEGLL